MALPERFSSGELSGQVNTEAILALANLATTQGFAGLDPGNPFRIGVTAIHHNSSRQERVAESGLIVVTDVIKAVVNTRERYLNRKLTTQRSAGLTVRGAVHLPTLGLEEPDTQIVISHAQKPGKEDLYTMLANCELQAVKKPTDGTVVPTIDV